MFIDASDFSEIKSTNMDYAKVVKGFTKSPTDIEFIEAQAKIELAKNLTKVEKNLLFEANSPSTLCKKIKKV